MVDKLSSIREGGGTHHLGESQVRWWDDQLGIWFRRQLGVAIARSNNKNKGVRTIGGHGDPAANELMLTRRPLPRIGPCRDAWVTATWPKRLTRTGVATRRSQKASTGTLTYAALLTSAASLALRVLEHPSFQRQDVVRVGDVDDQRLDTRPRIASASRHAALRRTKPPPPSSRAVAAPMLIEAPVTTSSRVSDDAVISTDRAATGPRVARELDGVLVDEGARPGSPRPHDPSDSPGRLTHRKASTFPFPSRLSARHPVPGRWDCTSTSRRRWARAVARRVDHVVRAAGQSPKSHRRNRFPPRW